MNHTAALPGTRHRRSFLRSIVLGGVAAAALWGLADHAHAAPSVTAKVRKGVLTVTGTSGPDVITLRLRAGDANILEVDVGDDGVADFRFDRRTFDRIVVNGAGGADRLTNSHLNGAFADTEQTTVDGGDGNDTVIGSFGDETLRGGPGHDVIDGNQGLDVAFGGDGNDLFVWDPGDSSDTLEGGTGTDQLTFNGSNANELLDLAATSNGHARLTRNIGTVTTDLATIETLELRTLGGTDTTTINPLAGTDLTTINTDLGAFGGTTDGLFDEVIVNGTAGDDTVAVVDDGPAVVVQGLAGVLRVTGGDPTLDRLTVNGLEGDDAITATPAAGTLLLLNLVP